MQRMIRQFAAEYTSKTSSTQDSSSPNSTKNQSLLKASLVASSPTGATAHNPVLSKLLMADQDSPLDLTVRKSQLDPSEQDGVLDLSTKKSPCAGSASLSHSPGCSTTPGNGENATEEIAIDHLDQPKSPLEKFMVRLCTYHQKHFVRVLNDICTEVQPVCDSQQLPGPENMDVSTCTSGCSQYRTDSQELGTSCSELKLHSSLDSEQSGPHGSLRILCHALKQAVDLKSIDRRDNCSAVVRRDFSELPSVRTSSSNPRDSPIQGFLTASNFHYSAKSLEVQTSGSEQEMGIRKAEDDKDQVQSRGLLGGYIAVKASNAAASEDCLEGHAGSQKNPFKVFPEETRDPTFTSSSPRRADKENALQCSSKTPLHQDGEVNDQEARSKMENHLQSSGKSKGSYHMHPVDKTHLENGKDSWLPTSPMPVVHHKATNGHNRAKSISASTKSTRKSKRSSGLRINDYDNQCDVVYISQPITECHFESKRAVSSKKTARKSTRGYYYNGECCELPTVRTLAKISHVQEGGNALAPRPEVLTSPCQGMALPGNSYLAAAEAVSGDGDKRASLAPLLQVDSSNKQTQGTGEPCPAENKPPEASLLKQRETSPAKAPTVALSPLPCPVLDAEESSLSVSSLQDTVVSSPKLSEEILQQKADTGTVLEAGSSMDSCKSSTPNENSSNIAESVALSVPEAVNNEESSMLLEKETTGKETTPEPLVLTDQDPSVSMDLLPSEKPTARIDLLPSLDESAAEVDSLSTWDPPADVELPLLSPIDPAEPRASVSPDPSEGLPADLPSRTLCVCPEELVARTRAVSPVVLPTSMMPETPAHLDLEPSEASSIESPVMVHGKVDLELPCPPSDSDAAELSDNFQCASSNGNINTELSIEGTQEREGSQSEISDPLLPIADTCGNGKGESVKETSEGEGRKRDGKAPPEPEMSETASKGAASSKAQADKKRKREKRLQVVSDRCLRSQQTLLPTEDSPEQSGSSTSLQLPQLQIKLSKSPGAKRFKREVHFDRAASVCFPSDCFHKTLLSNTGNALEGEPKQQPGGGNDITMTRTYKTLLSKETAVKEGQNGEGKSKSGTMLEICLEANSDKRSVHVPVEASEEGEKRATLRPGAPENSDNTIDVTRVLRNQHGTSSPPFLGSMDGSKHVPLERPVKHKKPALQFYNLRHTPSQPPMAVVPRTGSGNESVQGDSNVTDQQSAGNADTTGFSSVEVPSDNKPKFVEWCAEEENQELITNFNAQYMKVQKGWIQLEKEAQPAPKVKNKSDKLKEIWKSKKRTRKFKGSTEVQKLSPVQMLFMKAFDISNICNWFMETTETKSLVIVKKLNTRLPGDIPLLKLPLQKGCSSGIYPSSLQAERLKKHLKKFAAMTPAKNTIKTQRQWAKLRENPGEAEPEQAAYPKRTPPSEVSLEHSIEVKNTKPLPSAPVQTSSRILRKYSNLRGKLHSQHKVVKQEKSDYVTKHLSTESKPSGKSVCIKPLMSPKLAQQVKAVPLPAKSTLVEQGGKVKKGKGRLQEETSSRSDLQTGKKKTLNESSKVQGQVSTPSKDKLPVKKPSKSKHVESPTTRKQPAVERSSKHASRNEKGKKPTDSRHGKKKPPIQKGKVNPSQKASLLSSSPKQKVVRDSNSRSLKVASKRETSGKALTRSMKQIQENRTQSKRKLRAKKDSSPSKRRRLDAK